MQQEKHSRAMVLGLQHLLAMYSDSILVPKPPNRISNVFLKRNRDG